MSHRPVRTRFAPSPTGGLHIGGVRTALYSYLFAKKHQGQFILRIEDTDSARYVEGAEQYIIDALTWSGILPDEGPHLPSDPRLGSYRQSERKMIYQSHAHQLVERGCAYYAFDTEAELSALKESGASYNYVHRHLFKNSLSLEENEWRKRLAEQPYVVRFKNVPSEPIVVEDEVRGRITFDATLLDDKVLLKSDGLPTYHLAVVVDDYLMRISHVFRGEEWLPSAPIHVRLWQSFGWEKQMPKWVHLPLILSPSGQGKLSKREAKALSIPVFPLQWTDKKIQETLIGFKEVGFLPEAFINTLALIGWTPEGEQELFSKEELIAHFDIQKVHQSAARFDYEKAKWLNHKHLLRADKTILLPLVRAHLPSAYRSSVTDEQLAEVLAVVLVRCHLLSDFWEHAAYFFESPARYDEEALKGAWSEEVSSFFTALSKGYEAEKPVSSEAFEAIFKSLATEKNLKAGKLMLPFRVMLVGGKFGTHLFDICRFLGAEEVARRIHRCL